jgi:hypothetical protein
MTSAFIAMRNNKGAAASTLLIAFALCAVAAIFFMRLLPVVFENHAIQKAVSGVALESDSIEEAQSLFDRRVTADRAVTSINGQDLQISYDPQGKLVIDYAYSREIPLVANAYLLLKFKGSSATPTD